MMQFLFRAIVERVLDVLAAIGSYLAGRWLFDISTPEKDKQEVQRWRFVQRFPLELRWYRGLEYFHQVRGARILAQMA